jgi:tetratricopeptide (TPR) repeat protein
MLSFRIVLACAAFGTLGAFAQAPDWNSKSHQAKEAMLAGNYRAAIPLYKELTQAFPNNPGLAFNLALALHSGSEYEGAVQQFRRVVAMQPQQAPAWYLLGTDLQKLHRPAEAIEPLERCLKLDPANQPARLELGDALFASRRYSDAVTIFRSLTDEDSTNPKAWLGMGLSYSSLAGVAFDKLRSSFSDSAYVHMLAAQSQADQHQYRSAYQLYREALKRDPDLAEAHEAIIEIYRATGHEDWATLEQQRRGGQAATLDCVSHRARCLFSRGRLEEVVARTGDHETAETLYWEARAYRELALLAQQKLAELPPSAELHELMAVVYDLRELYPDAAREWRAALAVQPDNENFRKKLAWSLSGSGEWTETAEIAKELLAKDPNADDLRLLLGEALLNMQQPEEALVHLKKAILLDPKDLRAQASLGQAYLVMGNFQNAIPHLSQGLSTDRDGTLLYQLAQAYRAIGQGQKATTLLARYQYLRNFSEARKAARDEHNQITPP